MHSITELRCGRVCAASRLRDAAPCLARKRLVRTAPFGPHLEDVPAGMVNVLQPFVPRQVPNLPRPSLSLVDAEMRGAGIANPASALDELSEVHTAPRLPQVAKARFASLLVAPDPHGPKRPRRGRQWRTTGVISYVLTSLMTLLNQNLRKPPLNAWAQRDDLSGADRSHPQ